FLFSRGATNRHAVEESIRERDDDQNDEVLVELRARTRDIDEVRNGIPVANDDCRDDRVIGNRNRLQIKDWRLEDSAKAVAPDEDEKPSQNEKPDEGEDVEDAAREGGTEKVFELP